MHVSHPRIHVSAVAVPGLLSVSELQRQVQAPGVRRERWQSLLEDVVGRATQPPYTPATALPGRSAATIARRENDYVLAESSLERVMSAALAHVVDGELAHRDDALRQLTSMLDPAEWPEWRHPVNVERGYVADHRIGMHLRYLSLAYDWLHPALTPDQRGWLSAAIQERALGVVLRSREVDPFWSKYNNWTGIISAAMGTAGMAFAGEIEGAAALVDDATAYMRTYVEELGPDGEFNESPFYAASMLTPIRYFEALRYHQAGDGTGATGDPGDAVHAKLGRFGRWYANHVLLPDAVVPFGDWAPTARPNALLLGMAAELVGDPVLRWFYQRLRPVTGYANPSLELLTAADAAVAAAPGENWPLAIAYGGYGQHVISRSDWSPAGAACVVSSKAAHGWEPMRRRGDDASYHLDFDAGQVCIAAGNEQLIVDLGNSGGYSKGERGAYYGKGTVGHNVPMIDGANTLELGDPVPTIERAELAEHGGSWWRFDLTGAYAGARSVSRTVVHLLPGTVAILDELTLEQTSTVSLRWHTAEPCTPAPDGTFLVRGTHAAASCAVMATPGAARVSLQRHRYHPPFDTDYYGTPFADGHPYVEALVDDDRVTFLTLVAVFADPGPELEPVPLPLWRADAGGWRCGDPDAGGRSPSALARLDEEALSVGDGRPGGRELRVARLL
jgi:hypothetical protein